MDILDFIKVCLFIFFNMPIIISVIFLVIGGLKWLKKEDCEEFIKSGFTGVLLIAIVSVSVMLFPRVGVQILDNICYWIIRFIFVILITHAILDTYKKKINGTLKVVVAIMFIFVLNIFGRIF